MTQENYQPEVAEEAQAAPEPIIAPEIAVGEQLRAAREQMGLSVVDVAQRLKFAPRQIEALEAGSMAALPGLTFVRGFVRSYAKLLGLEADPLVTALEQAAARDAGPSTVQLQSLTATPQRFPMRNSAPASAWPWVLAMLVAVVGLGGFTLYQWQAPDVVTQPKPAATSAPSTSTTPVVAPNITPLATDPAPASSGAGVSAAVPVEPQPNVPAKSEPAKADAAKAEAAKADASKADAAKADPAKGTGKIHFVFAQESWTEVRQAGGQILLSKTNAAGSDVWLDGQPPFDFVIGNAQSVKLYYRGSEVNLAPYIKETVARMQLK